MQAHTMSTLEAAQNAARLVKGNGPHSFGGAIMLQYCSGILRQDWNRAEDMLEVFGCNERTREFIKRGPQVGLSRS